MLFGSYIWYYTLQEIALETVRQQVKECLKLYLVLF